MNDAINFEEDSEVVITGEMLLNITQLAAQVVAGEKAVAAIEEKLKDAKARLKQVQEIDLPDAMEACNLINFTTTHGHGIEVTKTLYASIAQKSKDAAAAWLVDNELAALVQENVVASFDKGQHAEVLRLVNVLRAMGEYNVSTTTTVNTGSVKSAIKELLEEGVEVPLELFGAYFAKKAVVTL